MSLFLRRFLLAGVLLAVAMPAAADTLTLNSTSTLDDAWLWAGGGGGGAANKEGLQLEAAASGYLKHVFLRFDLSAIPTGSTINSATYNGYCNGAGTGGSDPGVINVYLVTKPWVEDEISWNSYSSGNAWVNSGGDAAGLNDPAGSPISTIDLPQISAWSAISFDLTAAVQAWVNGTTNNGLLMKFADDLTVQSVQWCGSEAWVEGSGYQHVAPSLTIDYTIVPEPATMSLLGLGGFGLLIRRKRK